MGGSKIGILILVVGILFILIVLILECLRRKKQKERVRQMEKSQKIRLLNELAEPFGFFYIEEEDVFSSRLDAWQRRLGYEALYDRAAAGADMVIDAFPVYFDYAGKTWLIEFWKGQYGINIGGEVGIYHAKRIIPPYFYPAAHFHAADEDEMPRIQSRLERNGEKIYELSCRHWWLTGFRMGTFSKLSAIRLEASICFDEREMAQSFTAGLKKAGLPEENFCTCCNEVYVNMDFNVKQRFLARVQRMFVQYTNRFFCWSYLKVTRPFTDTADRMIFLYYLLPFCFRQMLCLGTGRFHKKYRRAERWLRSYRLDD